MSILIDIIRALLMVLWLAILARVILDWLIAGGVMRYDNSLRPFRDVLLSITEPILGPIRRYTTVGMIDLSPMIAILFLGMILSGLG